MESIPACSQNHPGLLDAAFRLLLLFAPRSSTADFNCDNIFSAFVFGTCFSSFYPVITCFLRHHCALPLLPGIVGVSIQWSYQRYVSLPLLWLNFRG
jgi:hypothetical protein